MGIYLILYRRADDCELEQVEDGNAKYGCPKDLVMDRVVEESEGFEFFCDVKMAYRYFRDVLCSPGLETEDLLKHRYMPNAMDTYDPYSRPKDCDALIESVKKMEFEDEYAKEFSLKLLEAMKRDPKLYWFISY